MDYKAKFEAQIDISEILLSKLKKVEKELLDTKYVTDREIRDIRTMNNNNDNYIETLAKENKELKANAHTIKTENISHIQSLRSACKITCKALKNKATKSNSEKLALIRIMQANTQSTCNDVFGMYREWKKERNKITIS